MGAPAPRRSTAARTRRARPPRRAGAPGRARQPRTRAASSLGARETAPNQRPENPEAVERRELLALIGGSRVVVDRDLEDPLAPLDQPGGDLRLDRESRAAQRQAA